MESQSVVYPIIRNTVAYLISDIGLQTGYVFVIDNVGNRVIDNIGRFLIAKI